MPNPTRLSRRRFAATGAAAGAAAGALLSFNPRVFAQGPIVAKIGTAPINDGQHEWMKRFGAAVEKDSGGKIKVEVYPGSALGQIPRMIEGTQFNQIQGYVGPPEFLAGVDPRFGVLSAPGLFGSVAHARRALAEPGFRQPFLALGGDKGLQGVGLFGYTTYSFIMRRAVRKIADFKGAKIRVLAAPLQLETIKRLGGTGVPMPLGEVLPALQQGALDGVMTATSVATPLRFYDAAKFAVETEHGVTGVITVMSKQWFDGLPAELRKVVSDAGAKVDAEISAWLDQYNAAQEKEWAAKGGEVIRFDKAEQAALQKLLADVGEAVLKDRADQKRLFDLLVAASKKTA